MATLAVFCKACDQRMVPDDLDEGGGVWWHCERCGTDARLCIEGGGYFDKGGPGAIVKLATPDGPAPVRVPSAN